MSDKLSFHRNIRMVSFFKLQLLAALSMASLIFSLTACNPKYEITTTQKPLVLGDTTVNVIMHEAASPGLTYFNLHDNENTSVKAALDVIGEHGGRVIELKHSGERRIVFNLSGNAYEFDPNRMFTELGREASLDQFSQVSDEALSALRLFADEVHKILNLEELDVLVTLHNTDNSYSINNYIAGGKYEKDIEIYHVSESMDLNDFFFVTDRIVFDKLSKLDQNIVLQDNENVTDDGSLSVWSSQKQLNYINVEAQNGHRRIQARMILLIHELFLSPP